MIFHPNSYNSRRVQMCRFGAGGGDHEGGFDLTDWVGRLGALGVLAFLTLALAIGAVQPAPAAADHGGPHFISKKKAKKALRRVVRQQNADSAHIRVSNCRYGRTLNGRPRWLCDLYLETTEPESYCGWGRVRKHVTYEWVSYEVDPC